MSAWYARWVDGDSKVSRMVDVRLDFSILSGFTIVVSTWGPHRLRTEIGRIRIDTPQLGFFLLHMLTAFFGGQRQFRPSSELVEWDQIEPRLRRMLDRFA